jgi:MFS family permease
MTRKGFVGLFAADITSALGNRISMVAIPWLVLVTTHDPAKMGLAIAAELVPYLVSGVFAAPLADRLGLRTSSIAADAGSALAVAAIAAIPGITFPTLAGLMAVSGTLRGMGDRAKHVMLRPLAEAAGLRMVRVASVYEGLSRTAMLVGAPLGGLLIFWFSPQGAIWVDAATFATCGALVATLVTLPDGAGERTGAEPYLTALRGGATYLWRDRLLFTMVMLTFAANVFTLAASAVFIPVWTATVLHSPAALGVVLGTLAAGAVLGSIVVAALAPKLPRYLTFLIGLAVAGAPPLVVLLSHNLSLVLTVTFVAGLATATCNPILGAMQYERVPHELQNRVFGLASAICYAGMPLGAVLGGVAVAGLGLNRAVLVASVLCLVVTAAPLFSYRSGVRAMRTVSV